MKTCVMNCGPSTKDLRSRADIMRECADCEDWPPRQQAANPPLDAGMDNVLASRLGRVAWAVGERPLGMAESVDFGLWLRRLLEEAGFEIRVRGGKS